MNSASLPYDNLEEVAILLQAVFSGNNETTQHSQEVFAKMAENPVKLVDCLMKIILSEKDGIIIPLPFIHHHFTNRRQCRQDQESCSHRH